MFTLHKPDECDNHKPVQHRDGKSPWCPSCGLTKNFKKPTSKIKVDRRRKY